MIVYLTPPDECKNYFGIDTETYLCIDNTRNEINPKVIDYTMKCNELQTKKSF